MSTARSDEWNSVEKKIITSLTVSPRVTAKLFSIARSDSHPSGAKNRGITIQVRMKNAAPKLLSRKNTEFWVTANQDSSR